MNCLDEKFVMCQKIAVVFDPDFGEKLCPLFEKFHVWVTFSKSNDQAINKYLAQKRKEIGPLAHGITQFEETELTPDLLDEIWEHHGEYSQDPPLSAMKIIGLELDRAIVDLLEEYDFKVCSHSAGEFDVVDK